MLGERFELLALEWVGVTRIDVLDDDPGLLDIGNSESSRRQRRD